MFFVTMWVKRHFAEPDPTVGAGFTLSDLRHLHKAGQISDLEFQKAKEMVLSLAQTATGRNTPEGTDAKDGISPADRIQQKGEP
jgi:hypothetical protein